MSPRLIIFDVDGTLIDSAAALVEAKRRTFVRFDLPFPGRDAALGVVGLSPYEAFAALVGPGARAADMASCYRGLFAGVRDDPAFEERLFPDVEEALRALAARPGARLGIATGKSRRGVATMIERRGWGGLFGPVRTADDAPSKPHPAMLRQAMAEAGAEPGQTVMVGDSSFDIEMARAAGVFAVAVSWGFQPVERLVACGAHAVVQSFADLPETIDRLLAQPAAA